MKSWGYLKWLNHHRITWYFGLLASLDNLNLWVVEFVDQHVKSLDIVIFIWVKENLLSIDLNPMIGFLMLNTFCNQKLILSSRRLWVFILMRFTLDLCLNDIINQLSNKIKYANIANLRVSLINTPFNKTFSEWVVEALWVWSYSPITCWLYHSLNWYYNHRMKTSSPQQIPLLISNC